MTAAPKTMVERLNALADYLVSFGDHFHAANAREAATALAQAQARVAELEKDAARYRWLREARRRQDLDRPVVPSVSYMIDCIPNPEFDAAIDNGIADDAIDALLKSRA